MLPEMRAELGFRLRNPPTVGRVSEKTRCTADSQVLSGAVTLWTLRNPNLVASLKASSLNLHARSTSREAAVCGKWSS
jgi:hypothetical protein